MMLDAIWSFAKEHWILTAAVAAVGAMLAEYVRRENAKMDAIRRSRPNG